MAAPLKCFLDPIKMIHPPKPLCVWQTQEEKNPASSIHSPLLLSHSSQEKTGWWTFLSFSIRRLSLLHVPRPRKSLRPLPAQRCVDSRRQTSKSLCLYSSASPVQHHLVLGLKHFLWLCQVFLHALLFLCACAHLSSSSNQWAFCVHDSNALAVNRFVLAKIFHQGCLPRNNRRLCTHPATSGHCHGLLVFSWSHRC